MSTETWSARIDWADECTDEQLASIAEVLAGHHGALTTNAAAGRVSAQLTVQATTLRQAIDNSLAAVACPVVLPHAADSSGTAPTVAVLTSSHPEGWDSDGRSRVHQGCTRTAHPCGGLTVAHATDAVL